MNDRTDRTVDRLVFGGAPLGNLFTAVSESGATRAIEAALAEGIRQFDTAPHYGLGLSERRLGSALQGRVRDSFTISTKVGRLLDPNPQQRGSDLDAGFDVADELVRRFDFTADGVRRSLLSSLDRLGLDFVDTAYIHDPAGYVDDVVDESLPALRALRDTGLARQVGLATADIGCLLAILERTSVDVVMVANRWTLLDRSAELLLQRCRDLRIPVVTAAPFNSGILAAVPGVPTDRFDYGPASTDVREQVRAMAAACATYGVPLAQAALQFGLRHLAVEAVAVGMRSAEEVRRNVRLVSRPTPESLWAELDLAREKPHRAGQPPATGEVAAR